MKKKFTFLMAVLMLLTMFASPFGVLADEASYVFNTDAGIAALGITKPSAGAGTDLSTASPYVVGQISMSVTHGGTNTRVWNSKGTLDLRIYNTGSLTFSAATGYNITGITITGSTVNVFNVNVGTYTLGSWSNSTTGASSVTFTATGGGKINTITVTYESTGGSSDPSISVSPNPKAVTCSAGSAEFTITSNIETPSYSLQFYEAATGDETAERPSWISTPQIVNNTLTLTYGANTSGARPAYFTVKSGDVESPRVTLTQAAYSYTGSGTFTKVTTLDDLEDGGHYVLYGVNGSYYGAMNATCSSGKMGSTSVSIVNNVITNPAVTIVWKLEKNDDNWDLYNEDAERYCYITGASSTSFALSSDKSESNYNSYTVSVNNGNFEFVGGSNRLIAIYQSDFRTYTSGYTLYLYKLDTPSEDPAITIANNEVEVPAGGGNGTIAITLSNMTVSGANAFSIQYYNNENQAISAPLWMSSVSVVASGEDYVVSYDIARNDDADRTAYFKVQATYENQTVESNLVTFSQDLYVAPTTYVLANNVIPGKQYIFVSHNASTNDYYAMGEQNDNNRAAVAIGEYTSIPNTVNITGNNVYEFLISSDATNNGYFNIYDAVNTGYLYAAGGTGSSAKNHLKVQDELTDNGRWTIEIVNGVATITAQGNASRNIIKYNPTNSPKIFSCYASGQQDIYLYAKADYTITINGYGNDSNVETGWNLIASPLNGTTAVTNVTNMTSNNYDLYRFNLNEELEWENYKAHSSSDFTTLEVGRGYLYANSTNVTLGFNGALNTTSTVTLAYDGWNLIGNSSSATRYVSGDYYIMNSTNSGITTSTRTGGAVNAMEGIFVNGDEGDVITFSSTPTSGLRNHNVLVINLNRNDKVIDCAIARLNSDRKLSKLTLFDDDTKIYIPQNGTDYAIVAMDDNTQAFGLNFHAKTTGKYTLSLGETSNLSYVHLFDRMTGEDIDMLLEDSYSFIGSPADSEERFIVRLSYNASSTGSETFAYQSGNGIIVNGEGELQIFDVTGRKVMTTTINGVQTVNGLNNGLYIFKLNEKTQKIVVR